MSSSLWLAWGKALVLAEAARKAEEEEEGQMSKLTRWANVEGNFTGTADTVDRVPPGVYDIAILQGAVWFVPLDARDDTLLRFPGTTTTAVVEEIELFWQQEAAFKLHDLPYKRGILLYGPPGSGKSCALRLIADDVVERGGVVMNYTGPDSFKEGYRVFRMVQPDTPIVVLMEDLDAILARFDETKVLNLLDGVQSLDKVVFLATTNYPRKLGPRIANRPSRFDRKYLVPHPSAEARLMYFESLTAPGDDVDFAQWAKDTDGLSLAHLKELFIAVVILGNGYRESLNILKGMRDTSYADNEEPWENSGQYA
jgi:hypothetical protein